MLDKKIIAEYNKTRNVLIDKTICHAPFTSINFEQSGNATACCYNRTHILGTFPENTIREMWFGEKANELRTYISNNDLGGGCQLCLKQLQSHNYSNSRTKGYDFYADSLITGYLRRAIYGKNAVSYPKVFEFELSNTCNLECVMCTGFFSSSILKNREGKPPMINPYNKDFVSQLEEFIPHLVEAKFLGGEPFLIDIYYDIWEMIHRINPVMKVSITTNGTILNNRVTSLLEKLNCEIIISVDSLVEETYEKIRVNAKHETLMKNFEWLYAYSQRKKTNIHFTVCPITLNSMEMPHLVEFCNKKEIGIFFNTVSRPYEYSLRSCDSDTLQNILNYYTSYDLKKTNYISTQNSIHFNDLIHQVRTWYDEKIQMENDNLVYTRLVEKSGLISISEKSGGDCRNSILKLVINIERRDKFGVNNEMPFTDEFFDPEYVKFIKKSSLEHLSVLIEKFGYTVFFSSYLDVMLLVNEDRLEADEFQVFSKKVKSMRAWISDPLLKILVRGMITIEPDGLKNVIINSSIADLQKNIQALYNGEEELVDCFDKSITELTQDVMGRIELFIEEFSDSSEIEKREKVNKIRSRFNAVLKRVPEHIAIVKLRKQVFIPPVGSIVTGIENISEEMIFNSLMDLIKEEV